ncbi:MAG: ABC transporter substrate-binding protein [Xanthobacteraceae bacterium]|nr:MAG: ABC transporter substrate-binding protein [Xanthobacteraceae bacterium]
MSTLTLRKTVAALQTMFVAFLALIGAAYAQDPIRIGSFLSVTGPASFLGEPELKTLQLYIEKTNSKGGILGRKLEFIHYDDGGDASKANGFVKRLIESDKVDIIVGGSTTGTTMASIPLIEKAEIPFISIAGGVVVVEPVKKWVFKTPGSDRHSIERLMVDMKKKGIKNVALMVETSGLGQSSKVEAHKVAPNYGITFTAEESYNPKDTDMTPQLTKIRNAPGVQAVAVFGFGQGPAIVTRNYAQLGIKLPLYHTHGVASQEFARLTDNANEGVLLSSPSLLVADELPTSDPQKAVLLAYRDEYRKRYNDDPSTFGGYAYDALMLALGAINKVGGTNKEQVRNALEQTKNYVGTAGMANMSAADHMGLSLSGFRLVVIKQGKFRLAQ